MERLPDAVLEIVFSYVGNALDFVACERTCKTFCAVLKKDAVWRFCQECQPPYQNQQPYNTHWQQPAHTSNNHWPRLYRERAFVVRVLHHCHTWQRRSDSVFVHGTLQVANWVRLVQHTLDTFLPLVVNAQHGPIQNYGSFLNATVGNKRAHCFTLRGDTLAVLLDLMERSLVTQFQRAYQLALHRSKDAPDENNYDNDKDKKDKDDYIYPSVSVKDFELQADLLHSYQMEPVVIHSSERYSADSFESGTLWPSPEFCRILRIRALRQQEQTCGVDQVARDRFVRRLAYRAGITKFDNELFEAVWASTIHLMVSLLQPACIQLASRPFPPIDSSSSSSSSSIVELYNLQRAGKLRQELHWDIGETMRDVPPLPKIMGCEYCSQCQRAPLLHTIVPKQVEKAAQRLGITHKVYGNEDWLMVDEHPGLNKATLRILKRLEIKQAQSDYRYVTGEELAAREKETAKVSPLVTIGELGVAIDNALNDEQEEEDVVDNAEEEDDDDDADAEEEVEEDDASVSESDDDDSTFEELHEDIDEDASFDEDMDLRFGKTEPKAAIDDITWEMHECDHDLLLF